jgi:hypothetical protein
VTFRPEKLNEERPHALGTKAVVHLTAESKDKCTIVKRAEKYEELLVLLVQLLSVSLPLKKVKGKETD